MKIKDGRQPHYDRCCAENTAVPGRWIIDFAKSWADKLEEHINDSSRPPLEVIIEHADKDADEVDEYGLTGAMYGVAVKLLCADWEYGEDLRKWHNSKYNYYGDGVVDPARLVFKRNIP